MTTQMNYSWLPNEEPKKNSFKAQVDPRLFPSSENSTISSRKYTREHMLSLHNPLEKAEFVSEIRIENKFTNVLENKKPFMQSEPFSGNNNNNQNDDDDTNSDLPLWAGVSKDDIGSFDTNGVYHLVGEEGEELEGPLEPQHNNNNNNNSSSNTIHNEKTIELFNNDDLFNDNNIQPLLGKREAKKQNNLGFDQQQIFMPFEQQQQQQQRGPESVQWMYRDPSGHIQGPFSSLDMQEWYQSGYFDLSLMVKRVDQPFFEPLGALVRKVNNLKTPFLTSWPMISPPSFFQNNIRPSLSTPIINNNGFDSTYPVSPIEENNAFMIKDNNFPIHSFHHLPTSPPLLPPIIQPPSSSSSQTSRMLNQNSFIINSNHISNSINNNLTTTWSSAQQQQQQQQGIGNLIHDPWNNSNIVNPSSAVHATSSIFAKPQQQQQQQMMYIEKENMINNAILNQQEIEQRYLQILRQNQQQQQQNFQQQRLLRQKMNMENRSASSNFDQNLPHPITNVPNLFEGVDQITHSLSHFNLKENGQKAKKEVEEQGVTMSKEELPSPSSLWSSNILDKPLNDDHLFISKKHQQLTTQKPSPPQVTTSFSANTATRVQPKSNLWGASGRPKRVSMTGGAPITQKPPIVNEKESNINTSKEEDDKKEKPPSQEFCKWCKVTLRGLDAGVNVDEILQMLLSFPVDEESSIEIIQDIIYANSASMDGRRFASDFMKRRKADMKGELNALLPKAILSEHDNSFKVVTTKKGRKKYHH